LRAAILFRIDAHAAEFVEREGLAEEPDALLRIEDRPAIGELDEGRGQQQERQGQDQHRAARREIEGALSCPHCPAGAKTVGKDEPARPQRLEIDEPAFALAEGQEFGDLDPAHLALEEPMHRQAAPIVGGDHDLARALAQGEVEEFVITGRLVEGVGMPVHHRPILRRGDERHRNELAADALLGQRLDVRGARADAHDDDSALECPGIGKAQE
jgi:hypothetical protein